MKMAGITILVIGTILLSLVIVTIIPQITFAHISKTFGNTTIEAGWLSEPPLASDMNSIVIQVSKGTSGEQTPVANALANLTLSAKYGTITKQLDFQPSPTTDGGYEAKILPTRVGPFSVVLQGDVKGQKVDSEFKIEDVESKSIFSFPDSSIDSTNTNNIISKFRTESVDCQMTFKKVEMISICHEMNWPVFNNLLADCKGIQIFYI
jgi:hypothetical protein